MATTPTAVALTTTTLGDTTTEWRDLSTSALNVTWGAGYNGTGGAGGQGGRESYVNQTDEAVRLAYAVVLLTALVVGVSGNFLVAAAFLRARRKTASDVLVVLIALTNAAYTVIDLPFNVSIQTGFWLHSGTDAMCKAEFFLTQAVTLTSALLMTFTAVVRYRAVAIPLRVALTPRGVVCTYGVLLGLSLGASAPFATLYGNDRRGYCGMTNWGRVTVVLYAVFFSVLISLMLVILVLYILTIRILRRKNRIFSASLREGPGRKGASKGEGELESRYTWGDGLSAAPSSRPTPSSLPSGTFGSRMRQGNTEEPSSTVTQSDDVALRHPRLAWQVVERGRGERGGEGGREGGREAGGQGGGRQGAGGTPRAGGEGTRGRGLLSARHNRVAPEGCVGGPGGAPPRPASSRSLWARAKPGVRMTPRDAVCVDSRGVSPLGGRLLQGTGAAPPPQDVATSCVPPGAVEETPSHRRAALVGSGDRRGDGEEEREKERGGDEEAKEEERKEEEEEEEEEEDASDSDRQRVSAYVRRVCQNAQRALVRDRLLYGYDVTDWQDPPGQQQPTAEGEATRAEGRSPKRTRESGSAQGARESARSLGEVSKAAGEELSPACRQNQTPDLCSDQEEEEGEGEGEEERRSEVSGDRAHVEKNGLRKQRPDISSDAYTSDILTNTNTHPNTRIQDDEDVTKEIHAEKEPEMDHTAGVLGQARTGEEELTDPAGAEKEEIKSQGEPWRNLPQSADTPSRGDPASPPQRGGRGGMERRSAGRRRQAIWHSRLSPERMARLLRGCAQSGPRHPPWESAGQTPSQGSAADLRTGSEWNPQLSGSPSRHYLAPALAACVTSAWENQRQRAHHGLPECTRAQIATSGSPATARTSAGLAYDSAPERSLNVHEQRTQDLAANSENGAGRNPPKHGGAENSEGRCGARRGSNHASDEEVLPAAVAASDLVPEAALGGCGNGGDSDGFSSPGAAAAARQPAFGTLHGAISHGNQSRHGVPGVQRQNGPEHGERNLHSAELQRQSVRSSGLGTSIVTTDTANSISESTASDVDSSTFTQTAAARSDSRKPGVLFPIKAGTRNAPSYKNSSDVRRGTRQEKTGCDVRDASLTLRPDGDDVSAVRWSGVTSRGPGAGGQSLGWRRQEQERRLTVMFAAVTAVFMLCWMPPLAIYITYSVCPLCVRTSSPLHHLLLFGRRFHVIGHVSDVFIYACFSRAFRENLRHLWSSLTSRCRPAA